MEQPVQAHIYPGTPPIPQIRFNENFKNIPPEELAQYTYEAILQAQIINTATPPEVTQWVDDTNAQIMKQIRKETDRRQ